MTGTILGTGITSKTSDMNLALWEHSGGGGGTTLTQGPGIVRLNSNM